jgi:hypothetical protein
MNNQNLQPADDFDAADPIAGEFPFDFPQTESEQPEPLLRSDFREYNQTTIFDGKRRPSPLPSHLFPFHCFSDEIELTVSLPVQKAQTRLKQIWSPLYMTAGDGSGESYAAELLVFKHKLYNQGNAGKPNGLPNQVRLYTAEDFYLFTDNFADKQRCFDLVKRTLFLSVQEKLSESEGRRKTGREFVFRRCESLYSEFEPTAATQEFVGEIGIELSDYWLDWFEAASAVGFDFEYLAKLAPLEMRAYELIKLLYYDRHILPLKTIADGKKQSQSREVALETDYELFAGLMPIPVLEKKTDIETQIKNLCRVHIRRGFLHSVGFRENEIIFTFNKF